MRACLAEPSEVSVVKGSDATTLCTSLACAASIVCSEHTDHIDKSHTVWKCPLSSEDSGKYTKLCSLACRILGREKIRSRLSEDTYDWRGALKAVMMREYGQLKEVLYKLDEARMPITRHMCIEPHLCKYAKQLLKTHLDQEGLDGIFNRERTVQAIAPDVRMSLVEALENRRNEIQGAKENYDSLIIDQNKFVLKMIGDLLMDYDFDLHLIRKSSLYEQEFQKINGQWRETCKFSLVTAGSEISSPGQRYSTAEQRGLKRKADLDEAACSNEKKSCTIVSCPPEDTTASVTKMKETVVGADLDEAAKTGM